MSLIGNLEDLSLPDILQIISLSKKSGILSIHRGEEEGKVFLRQGKVVLTSGPKSKRNLGDLLVERRTITPGQLADGVRLQREGGMQELLGHVLVRTGAMSQEDLEQVVQTQIEDSVFYFLTWREGTFKFDLSDVDDRSDVGVDPQVIISQRGIDTQWLVLEGTRLLDERQRRIAQHGPEPPGEEELPPESAVILLVDDDDLFAERMNRAARLRGHSLNRVAGVTEAREFLAASLDADEMVLAIDVVMPTADGRGFLGGVELARHLVAEHPLVRFQVITAYPDDSVQDELRRLDATPYLVKPELSGEKDDEVMATFVDEVLRGVRRSRHSADDGVSGAPRPPAANRTPAPAVPSPVSPEPVSPTAGRVSGELAEEAEEKLLESRIMAATRELEVTLQEYPALRLMVEDLVREVHQAYSPSEVGLSILRLASELLERAILFKVRGGVDAVSLGGFGFLASTIKNRDGLRNLVIQLTDSPLLREAIESGRPIGSRHGRIADEDLLGLVIGLPVPPSWVVVPARTDDTAFIVLYGDGGPAGKDVAGIPVISRFLALAGYIMQKLHRDMAAMGP